MVLILKCNNGIVTDEYLKLVGDAFEKKYDKVMYFNSIKEIQQYSKKNIVVVARLLDAICLYLKGYKKMVMWFQGVEPEESFLTHKSKLRLIVLSRIENFILKRTLFSFFVSNEMKNHYENKYSLKFCEDRYYCMPCLNTEIHSETFKVRDKYNNNYFAYVGSMAIWQKFEDTVKIYKKIEKLNLNNMKFYVFTGEQEEAERILIKYDVKSYSIDFVKNDDLPNVLGKIKFGFIIRDDNVVNRVATPTKISTYLSCGMIPIYSDCLKDFAEQAKNLKYVIKNDKYILNHINTINNELIDATKIYDEYKHIFDTYYSREHHIDNIYQMIMKLNF